GGVSATNSSDANVLGVRKALEMVANNPHLEATALQTVGSKGYDGFALALVTG
ncbi:MAG: methyltransferase, partial [Chloroflexota bacterium]